MLKGIGASGGVYIGKAYVLRKEAVSFNSVSSISPEQEKERYAYARREFEKATRELVKNLAESAGEGEAAILEGHIMMAADPEILAAVEANMDGGATAEEAIFQGFGVYHDIFASMEDELMRQRAADIHDIRTRLIEILTSSGEAGPALSPVKAIEYECVLVAKDLTPSDTGQMDKKLVKAIVTEVGGMTAHTAIIARALELPAVMGVDGAMEKIENGDVLIVDGSTGEVRVNPSEREIQGAREKQKAEQEEKHQISAFKRPPSLTADGKPVELWANIGSLDDLESALNNGAEGIGLFRTEILFMDRNAPPSEEDQFAIYKKAAETMAGKPVVIRTLDIGGDKDVPYLGLGKEDNPFLGYRAIRLCLDRPDIFKPQIRALLRAAVFGQVQIMLPMISGVSELRRAKALIEECAKELAREGVPYQEGVEVGIMIETPAAVAVSDLLAKECGFFSIGTNDLIQYMLAVDRGNKKIAPLYSVFDPAVLRAIATVIENGHRAGILVGMCGEAAGDPALIPFLLAAGLDEFSMTASLIPFSRKHISEWNVRELVKILPHTLNFTSAEEAREYLNHVESQ